MSLNKGASPLESAEIEKDSVLRRTKHQTNDGREHRLLFFQNQLEDGSSSRETPKEKITSKVANELGILKDEIVRKQLEKSGFTSQLRVADQEHEHYFS